MVPACESGSSEEFFVPADKQLVIHHVSFESPVLVGNPVPTKASALLSSRPFQQGAFGFSFGLLDFPDSSFDLWEKSFPIEVTAPPGANVQGLISWDDFGATNVKGMITISGEYVSVP